MSSETHEISLKDAVEFIVDNRGKTAPTVDAGIALIATNCVNNKDLYPQKLNLRYISQDTYKTWFRAHPKPGDILLTNKGSQNGAVCLVPDPVDFCIAQDMVALRADQKKLYPLYLFAALRSEIVQKRMKALNVDAVIPHLKKTDFDKLFIPLPNRRLQVSIGDLYFDLSSRIELLRETNATLEAIAQALFKSWFVDFVPVRTKAEGRELEGVPPEIAALFPSEFADSALGEIPKGWCINTLAEHVNAERGLSYKGAGLCSQGEGQPMHNLNSVYEGGGYKYPGIKFYSGNFKERHLSIAGDIIVTNTEQGHEHRLIGFPAVIPAIYPEGLFSHHLYRLRRKVGSPLTQHTLYYLLMTPYVREQIISCANGSTVNMLKTAGLEIPRFVCPRSELTTAYEELTKPLHLRIEQNIQQAEELATIRDALLPRLMSGKLLIPEVQEAIQEDTP